MQKTRFERAEEGGLRIHVLPTDRFKTYAVSMYIGSPLTEETVTPHALIPFVLRRGNRAYTETKAFREKLDELYGAGFGFDIYKRANNQIVQFRMDTIADRYTGAAEDADLLRETLTFLLQTVGDPALENNGFLNKYVDAEKVTVHKRLEAIINDKARYAAERCTQEMFANDAFRFNALGRMDAIEKLEARTLYESYLSWISRAQIDLYVVGDTNLSKVLEIVKPLWKQKHAEKMVYQFGDERYASRQEVNEVIERLDVNQGKLNMGLRVPIYYPDEIYPAAMMYNGILGSYPHSKLFINVREKASLAYYASSRLDGYKGMLMIQSGIEIANYKQAVEIIKEQLNAIADEQISDLEMDQTKAMMTNQLNEVNDSAFEIIALDFNAVLTGTERTVESIISAISKVTKPQIADIAQQVKLDTIYFLRDRKGEKSE